MTRLMISSAIAVALLSCQFSGSAAAHEGHQQGQQKAKQKQQAPKPNGFDSRFAPGERFRGLARNGHHGDTHDGGEFDHHRGFGRFESLDEPRCRLAWRCRKPSASRAI